LLSERVLLLSGALRSYVGSEAQCVKFLSERVETALAKLATARKELLAYAALSMKVRFCSCIGFASMLPTRSHLAYCFVTTVPTGLHRADHRGSGRTAERRDNRGPARRAPAIAERGGGSGADEVHAGGVKPSRYW
jgi:hypothetical protein